MMTTPVGTLSHTELLDRIRSVSEVFAVSEGDTWRIEVVLDDRLHTLGGLDSPCRSAFTGLDDVSDFLDAAGISEFLVVRGALSPGAEDYEKWLRYAIYEGLREADDPNTEWVANDVVNAAAQRQILETRAHTGKANQAEGEAS
jgi:hypothetical protein